MTFNFVQRLRRAVGSGIRSAFEALTGWSVYAINPRGTRLYRDIREYLPELEIQTVFDVGANVGQSAAHYLDVYPSCVVYSFEPVCSTFKKLEARYRAQSRVHCFNLAFSDRSGNDRIALEGNSVQYRLVQHAEDRSANVPVQKVRLATIDSFCQDRDISRIDILKVDTEGHDLGVISGAERMLNDRRIDIVEAEVSMSPLNKRHVSIEKLKRYMEERGYYLFGLYEQVGEWPLKSPVLRRVNVVFLSPRVSGISVE